jgi:hypothetical protein
MGEGIRILDALVAPVQGDDTHPLVITMLNLSEIYTAS